MWLSKFYNYSRSLANNQHMTLFIINQLVLISPLPLSKATRNIARIKGNMLPLENQGKPFIFTFYIFYYFSFFRLAMVREPQGQRERSHSKSILNVNFFRYVHLLKVGVSICIFEFKWSGTSKPRSPADS